MKTPTLNQFVKSASFLFLLGVSVLFNGSLLANDSLKINSKHVLLFGLKYQSGSVINKNSALINLPPGESPLKKFSSLSFQIMHQTTGKREWEQRFNYPIYGVGINITNFSQEEHLGLPISIYGHFSSSFVRTKLFDLFYEINLGIAFNWEPYILGKNEYYLAQGSNKTVYISPGIGLKCKVNKRSKIAAMLSVSHFSNGATKLPNKGLNMISPSLYFFYRPQKEPLKYFQNPLTPFTPSQELLISFFIGKKNRPYLEEDDKSVLPYSQQNFSEYGVQFTYNRQVSYKSKVGIGIDFLIDNAVRSKISKDEFLKNNQTLSFSSKAAISIFPSYELVVNKTSVVFQTGIYLLRKKVAYPNPAFYQRIGIRQQLPNNLVVGINVRAYRFQVADFIEWMVGYQL